MNLFNLTFIMQLVNTALLALIPLLVILFAWRYSVKVSKKKKAQSQSRVVVEHVKPNHKSMSVWILSILVIGLLMGLLLSASKGMVIYEVPIHSNDITFLNLEIEKSVICPLKG